MLNWTSKTIQISELKEYEHNPRRIGKKEFEKLLKRSETNSIMADTQVNYGNFRKYQLVSRTTIFLQEFQESLSSESSEHTVSR